MNLGDRIGVLRRDRGMTKGEAARLLGVADDDWRAIERGHRRPDDETLARIAELLGVDADALLGGSEGGMGHGVGRGTSGGRGDWRDDDLVTGVFDDAKFLYLAVSSRHGPSVTPVVFEIEGRRLWFLTGRGSVKARVIRRDPLVGGLVRAGQRTVILSGRARAVDPATVRGIFSARRLLSAPLAAPGFLGRNFRFMKGDLRDRPAQLLPVGNVPIAVKVTRVMLLEGWRVVATWGEWRSRDGLLDGAAPPARPPDVDRLPHRLRGLVESRHRAAVLGWDSASGPLALPALWDGGTGVVETSAEAMGLAGAGSQSRACVTVDRWGHRLKARQGVVVMGSAEARVGGEKAYAVVDQERLTYWRGRNDNGTIIRAHPSS
jgi:transcriptional regulator with XRE-family HTH domain